MQGKATKITSLNINKLTEGTYQVDKGLFIRVRGRYRYWIFRYQLSRTRREISLGSTLDISISEAKKTATNYRKLLAQNIDPMNQKEEVQKDSQCPFLSEILEDALQHIVYIRQFSGSHTLSHWRTTFKQIKHQFQTKRINEITSLDLVEYLKTFWTIHPRKAQESLGRLHALFEYAVLKEYIFNNPAEWKGNLDKYLPSIKLVRKNIPEQHYHALSFIELKEIIQILHHSNNTLYKAILFGILTVGRCCEWRLLQWNEFNERQWLIVISQIRRKDRKAEDYLLPLSKQALNILLELKKNIWSPYIFVSDKTGRPYGRETPLMCFKRLSKTNTTYHGVRSTFSDWCAKNNKSFIVSEKCLMHSVGNSVFRAYQRDDLLKQRRQLLQEWADALYSEN